MKIKLIKILSIFSFLLMTIFILSSSSVYAASSSYHLATYFTFSSDMNIEKGFEYIKPYILYDSSYNACYLDYEFTATHVEDNQYKYTGYYPDGTYFSISTFIKIIDDASGTYVEAQYTKGEYRQSIYVTDLKDGKTTSDCLMECWRNRWMNIKEPTYSIDTGSSPTGNIYNRATSFTTGAGDDYTLLYYAIYNPAKNEETTTPPDDEIQIPPGNIGDNSTQEGDSSSDNEGDSSNNKDDDSTQSPQAEEKDPVLIILIIIGGIILLVLGYMLYKVIRSLLSWLNE